MGVYAQGQMLGGSTIRISWGRSSTSRASANAAAAAAPGAFGGLFPGAAGVAPYGTTAAAGAFGAGAFPGDYGAAGAFGGAAPTATSDPYSAYYSALAQNDSGAFQVRSRAPALARTPDDHYLQTLLHL